jgi:predicted GIY-YIG superfamily endonuclease
MSYVYVIGRERGPVKVGVSDNPRGRLTSLQTGCPFKLSLLHQEKVDSREYALWVEAHFRAVYERERLMGEWFKLDAELAIEGIETTIQIDEHFKQERQH